MSERFYQEDLPMQGEIELTGTEAHHLRNVLRAEVGQEVELFNGQGRIATARITRIGKKSLDLEILTSADLPAPTHPALTLATAVPKGDRFKWLIEKATEIGVTRLIPLSTHRSVVSPRETKLEKLQQSVIAACKQSRRNFLMEITPPTTWSEFLSQRPAASVFLLADPNGQPFARQLPFPAASEYLLTIGPEGGLTPEEVQQATDHGATLIGLGENILRMETAAIVLAGAVGLCVR